MCEAFPAAKFPEMSWAVGDATKLEMADGSFDVVIDKGTFDALVCGEDGKEKELVREMLRVVAEDGVVVEVSNGTPEKRLKGFEEVAGEVRFEKVQLSLLARMINMVRSGTGSKSLKETIQDPEMLRYGRV